MDTIFFNGCIRTLDNSEKVAEAVGIENGRIVLWELIKKRKLFPAKNGLTLREG